MASNSPLTSAAFRFALMFAAVFAGAAMLLLGVVHHQVDRYARRATIGSLEAETAILRAEPPGALAAAIGRRMRASADGNFQYLLLDPRGRARIGAIPVAAARAGLGEVLMREHPPTPTDPERPERLVTLGTRLADGSLLVVATDGYDVARLGGHVERFTIGWAVAVTLLALAGGWAAGRLFLLRLGAANLAIERIMAGRIEQRLPMIGMAPELDDLARNLNRMLDRIQGLMQGLRQVSTDVAHDLRTPLTRLRQMLEAAREAGDAGEMRGAIDAAIAQADQLLATFRAMLRLAEIEGGGRRAAFAPVDLAMLLATLVETYDPVAADAGHRLSGPAPAPAMVDGDADLLAQLFANLIENAILHTPPGTRVEVAIARVADEVAVRVRDDGPGVPAAERAHILGRFYQLDPSRSRGGAGLGLSIAAAIAELHGTRLELGDAAPGMIATVRFKALGGHEAAARS